MSNLRPRPAVIILVASLLAPPCPAQGMRYIGVDDEAERQANFRLTYQEPGTTHDFGVVDGMIAHATRGTGSAIFLLDTTPDDSAPDRFRDVVVEFDFVLGSNLASIGVVFGGRDQTAFNLAVFNIGLNGEDSLRFITGCSAHSPRIGAQAGTTVARPAGAWRAQHTYHATLTLAYTGTETADATFAITDPSGRIPALSADASGLPVAPDFANLGFRSAFMVPATTPNRFDNFIITDFAPVGAY
ncbi:MAG: hypothetical protein ABII82_18225 [Verrucomicrobiota bacterium]